MIESLSRGDLLHRGHQRLVDLLNLRKTRTAAIFLVDLVRDIFSCHLINRNIVDGVCKQICNGRLLLAELGALKTPLTLFAHNFILFHLVVTPVPS